MVDEFLALCKKFDIQNVKPLKTPDYYQLQDKIELKNVSFGYTKDKQALKNINLTIKKGEFIGIAGLSGAGKTTLADIIAGLFDLIAASFLLTEKRRINRLKSVISRKNSALLMEVLKRMLVLVHLRRITIL